MFINELLQRFEELYDLAAQSLHATHQQHPPHDAARQFKAAHDSFWEFLNEHGINGPDQREDVEPSANELPLGVSRPMLVITELVANIDSSKFLTKIEEARRLCDPNYETEKTYFGKLNINVDTEMATRVIDGEPDPAYEPVKLAGKGIRVVKFVLDNPNCEFIEIKRSGIWPVMKSIDTRETPPARTVTVTISSARQSLKKIGVHFDGEKRNNGYWIHM